MKKMDLILIDSFQEKYYKYCPFLSSLREKNFSSNLMPIIGYQQHLASLFSGRWPQEVDVWNTFKFSPEKSIFKWTKLLPRFEFFDNKLVKYFIDFISYCSVGINDMLAVRIPVKTMKNFDINLRRPITARGDFTTIFDLLRDKKINFSYFKGGLKHTYKSNNFLSNLKHLLLRSDSHTINAASKDQSDFKFIYLTELDHITHKFGTDSLEVRNKLKETDQLLERYLERSNRSFIILSDHGMIDVKETVDIISQINSLDISLNKDYLFFLESVLVRFWFFNNKAREKITNELKKIKEGHILDKEERRKFGIDFQNNQFGDLFFILEPGKIIMPNYYQTKGKIKAMHGYLPQFNKGIFLTNLEIKPEPNQIINFIDIIPTVADFLNLIEIGSGRSLLK